MKGTRHATLDAIEVDADGPVGDRVFCLVDPARARVLRTIENPSLIAVESHWEDRTLTCAFPRGPVVSAEPATVGPETGADYWGRTAPLQTVEGPWAAAFSRYLGRPVELARICARGAVVYGGCVTVLHADTLRGLAGRLDQPGHDLGALAARFRSTLVVDGGDSTREADWIGRRLRLGEAEVEIRGPVPRCAVIDLDPSSGVRNLAVLRAAGVRPGHEPEVGVDAVVVRPGRMQTGDVAVLC